MIKADHLMESQVQVNGKWVIAKPIKQPLIRRIKDAIQVVKGNAEAVVFEEQ